MANRSDREPGQPVRMSWASLPAKQSGTRLADTIKASGQHERLHQQAGQKTAPDPIVKTSNYPLHRGSHPQKIVGQLCASNRTLKGL